MRNLDVVDAAPPAAGIRRRRKTATGLTTTSPRLSSSLRQLQLQLLLRVVLVAAALASFFDSSSLRCAVVVVAATSSSTATSRSRAASVAVVATRTPPTLSISTSSTTKRSRALAVIGGDNSGTGEIVVAETAATAEMVDARSEYVRDVLIRRLRYVDSGRRARDFAKWVKDRGGDATIFSMHGVENSAHEYSPDDNIFVQDDEKGKCSSSNRVSLLPFLGRRNCDPFPTNRLNLDLVLALPKEGGNSDSDEDDIPPSCYTGKALHLSVRPRPNPIQLCVRAVQLGVHFAPVLSTVGLAVVSKKFRQDVWFAWLARCIGSGGAAWIKWGQWSSTRNDMFPESLCSQLETLHNDAPAHRWEFSERSMESSLGLSPGTLPRVFDEFDTEPMASGSIAQVHRAVLDGHLVAVKIRHPRVAELIDMDFRLMSAAARIFDFVPGLSWLRIRESVDQFSHTMAAQSDLHVEAHHLEVLNNNFRNWPHVRFPQPLYASAAVIIETFESGRIVTGFIDMYERLAETIQGESIGLLDDDESEKAQKETYGASLGKKLTDFSAVDLIPIGIAKFIVTTGLGVYLKMLLVDNLMHAGTYVGVLLGTL